MRKYSQADASTFGLEVAWCRLGYDLSRLSEDNADKVISCTTHRAHAMLDARLESIQRPTVSPFSIAGGFAYPQVKGNQVAR